MESEVKESKLSRRITWRLILIIVFFNVFIIGAVISFVLSSAEAESETRAHAIIDGVEGKLITMLRAVQISSANSVGEIEENLESPEKIYEALEHEIRLNYTTMGCAVAFVPNYFPSQGHWYEPYVIFTDSDRVERRQIGSADHDYFTMDWYMKGFALERGQGYLTDPYFDKDGGKRTVCTYASPVFDRQGRKIGVYGIDLNISWLGRVITEEERKVKLMLIREEDMKKYDDLFFIQVLDSKGHKIVGSESIDSITYQQILQKEHIRFEKMQMYGRTYFISSKRLSPTGFTLVVAQHKRFVLYYGYVLCIIILLLMILGGLVIFFFLRWSIRRAILPLGFLSDSAQEVAKGHFDTSLPTFKHNDEITRLRNSFDTMQQSLKRYVKELKQSTAAKASMESELNVAHNIQMSMLPTMPPTFATEPEKESGLGGHIDIYGLLTPAKAVGGDLFDFYLRDGKLFFCIGDVSGKGVPASLVMAVTRTLFRSISAHIQEPSLIVEAMNSAICEGNDSNMFVTLFVGVLDLASGQLQYCNAGHNPPVVMDPAQHVSFLPVRPNLPIGWILEKKYEEQVLEMAPGTMLFLYTDGLTEAENAQLEQFGEQRVTDVINTFNGSSEELVGTMTAAVRQFVGETEQSDDITMLAIRFK